MAQICIDFNLKVWLKNFKNWLYNWIKYFPNFWKTNLTYQCDKCKIINSEAQYQNLVSNKKDVFE